MRNNKGFTLVEVIVVVVILSILATMLIPRMTGFLSKSNDEKNQEIANDIMQLTQGYFYELYAVNSHDSRGESIVVGKNNENPGVSGQSLNVSNNETIYITDIHHKLRYPKTTEIFRTAGYKVKVNSSGSWESDIPFSVMVITGNYKTYCDPTKNDYDPEKVYTVYGIVFNKNVQGDFFVMLKNGKVKYPQNRDELDQILDAIEDDNETDPKKHLVKQLYVLKSGNTDDYSSVQIWNYYHETYENNNVNKKVNYGANIGKNSDW